MDIKKFLLLPVLFFFFAGIAVAQDSAAPPVDPPTLPPAAEIAPAAPVPDETAPADSVPSNTTPTDIIPPAIPPVVETVETTPADGSPVEGEPSFRLSDTDTGLLFFQKLTWEKARYAIRYTVVLERKNITLDIYTEVLRRNTDLTYVDISVPPGDYRFKVLSFNVLGRLDSESDWEEFSILEARYPSVVEFSPTAFYFDRLTPRIITLTGENLLPEAEILLVDKTGVDENGDPLIITPVEILRNELGENARLIFAEESLVAGVYEIVVKNPGGLETRTGDFAIAMAKPYDLNLAGGYMPNLTIFGQKDYFLNHFFIPLGMALRANFVPFKRDIGYIGFEATPSWTYLTSQQDIFETSAHLVMLNIDGLYQYWLRRRELALNARAGFGVAGIFNYHFVHSTGKTSDSMNTFGFSLNAGASVQWLFYKQLFVEGGLDYVHIFHSEIPMGFVRIGLFGGYQL